MRFSAYLRQSLKTRLTLFTLAIFLVGIWSLAFYVSRMLREDLQRQLGEQQFSTVSLLAAQINEELDNRLRALELVAGNVDESMIQKPAALQKLLADRPILSMLFNGGTFATRLDGTAIADFPVVPGRVGTSYIDRESVSVPLKEGKSVIGRPAMGKTLLAPIFSLTVPIRDHQGKVVGALCGTINLGKPSFLDKVTESKYGKTGGYLLIAPQYRLVITASDKRRVMEVLPAAGIIPVMDRFNDGYEGTDIFVNRLGVELLVSVKKVPVSGWNMSAVLPTEEAFAPIHAMQRHILLAATLLTLLAGALTWGLTWRMLRRQLSPMIAATRTLTALSGTNQLPQALPITSQDEIGELIGSFNGLLETVGKREEALERASRRNEVFLRNASDGIHILDSEGNVLEVSDSLCEMLGYSREELIGANVSLWVAQSSEKELKQRIAEQIAQEGRSVFETRHRRSDGSIVDVEVSGHPLELEGKRVLFNSVRDITERKQAEAAREQLASQLRESQKMEALGTLAGGVAHDFNNALAMIIGNVELARQDVGPGHPALVSLDEIGKASRRAKDLVQQILSFGRRQRLDCKPTSLALVVVETARLLRATLPATVSLNVNCEADAPAVLADASQVKQILLNLCANALHAVQSDERPGVIEIRLYACDHTQGETHGDLRPGRYACLSVRDNGPGMDEATRERIFEPFFTTKPTGEGTGLGLSVVHGIAQAHEASIEVDSAPGEGSAFRIYFPAIDAPVTEPATPNVGAAPVDRAGKRVLYVDDEEAIVFLMKRLLERRGFHFSGYTNPHEALAVARAGADQFDLVVTDYSMPGMSGLELVQALRGIRADLPVVLASGYITEELRVKALAAGVRELIYKPNTVDDLCEAVARCAIAQSRDGAC